MNGMGVYIDARAAEVVDTVIWGDADKLTEYGNQVRSDLGRIYRFLDRLDARAAELRGPAKLPVKPSNRTVTQDRVSRCPRCGSREIPRFEVPWTAEHEERVRAGEVKPR